MCSCDWFKCGCYRRHRRRRRWWWNVFLTLAHTVYFGRLTTISNITIFTVGHMSFGWLITRQFDWIPNFWRNMRTISTLAKQWINRLNLIPSWKRNAHSHEMTVCKSYWSNRFQFAINFVEIYLARKPPLANRLHYVYYRVHLKIRYEFHAHQLSSRDSYRPLQNSTIGYWHTERLEERDRNTSHCFQSFQSICVFYL